MLSAVKKDNSPFEDHQISALQESIGQLDWAQTAWLSGYLAGKLAGQPFEQAKTQTVVPLAPSQHELRVFYASQTGNGEQVAHALATSMKQAGLRVRSQSLDELRPALLKKIGYAVFVISTHGDGDPPDDAIDLLELLSNQRAPDLESLSFCVLALGDKSYSQFCEAGRRLEKLLLACRAKSFADRVECDVNYQDAADEWASQILEYALKEPNLKSVSNTSPNAGIEDTSHLAVVSETSEWHRKHPFPASVERVQKITGPGSSKEVFHIELSLEDSGLNYSPGDSLGVWAFNDPALVAAVLTGLGIGASATVEVDDGSMGIGECLQQQRELTRLSRDTVMAFAAYSSDGKLQSHLEELSDDQSRAFIEQRQLIDLVTEYPARMSAQQLTDLLRPLAPRSYSIASSQASVDQEVHLTVASLYSNAIGQQRSGVASGFLNQRLQPGDEVGVFLEPNKRFQLPQDRSKPLILIAAGTGIAPYRAFLQQLEQEDRGSDVWLIFGNPHMRTDFLYQREWLNWRSKGLITRIDGAFSRDQQEKRYVQDVIRERADELNHCLDKGAHIYICGALRMGQEVEQALRQTIAQRRGLNDEAALGFMAELRRDRRLLKDLY